MFGSIASPLACCSACSESREKNPPSVVVGIYCDARVAGVNNPVSVEMVETNSNSEVTQPGAISKPSEKPPENPRKSSGALYSTRDF
jgi:hypothetical protein